MLTGQPRPAGAQRVGASGQALHKLATGDGYAYLTRQAAAGYNTPPPASTAAASTRDASRYP